MEVPEGCVGYKESCLYALSNQELELDESDVVVGQLKQRYATMTVCPRWVQCCLLSRCPATTTRTSGIAARALGTVMIHVHRTASLQQTIAANPAPYVWKTNNSVDIRYPDPPAQVQIIRHGKPEKN
jgi:hypothetical protein